MTMQPQRIRTIAQLILFLSLVGGPAWAQTSTTRPVSTPDTAPEAAPDETSAAADSSTARAPTTAQPAAAKAPERPAVVFHTPLHRAPSGKPLRFQARVSRDWLLESVTLMVRVPHETAVRSFPLLRSRPSGFEATVPGALIRHGVLTYSIHSKGKDGVIRQHFASSAQPHPVTITGYSSVDTRDKRLARYGGHRSRFALRGDVVAYGSRPFGAEGTRSERYSDQYWRTEAEYTYRTLDVLHDFRFGIGVMRAQWPTDTAGTALVERYEDDTVPDTPGVNYGFGEVNFELHRWFSAGARLILGATGEGFAAGLGAIARIGDLTSTHLSARIEGLQDVGVSTDLRLHWTTIPRFPMNLGTEYTNWPASLPKAANLSFGVGWEASDAFTIELKIGNAKRAGSFDAGLQGGLSVLMEL